MSISAPPKPAKTLPLLPLSASSNWRRAFTRNDSHGSSIAGVVSDMLRQGLAGSLMSITGTPGFTRPRGLPSKPTGYAVA